MSKDHPKLDQIKALGARKLAMRTAKTKQPRQERPISPRPQPRPSQRG